MNRIREIEKEIAKKYRIIHLSILISYKQPLTNLI